MSHNFRNRFNAEKNASHASTYLLSMHDGDEEKAFLALFQPGKSHPYPVVAAAVLEADQHVAGNYDE